MKECAPGAWCPEEEGEAEEGSRGAELAAVRFERETVGDVPNAVACSALTGGVEVSRGLMWST